MRRELRRAERRAHLSEAGQRADDLRLVVGDVPHDDVGVPEGSESAELVDDLRYGAPDERRLIEAAVSRLDDALGHGGGLRRRLADIDIPAEGHGCRFPAVAG